MLKSPCQKIIITICVLAVSLFIVNALPVRADIYTYIDSNNVVHFTNVPTTRKYKILFRDYGSFNHMQISPSALREKVYRISERYGVDPMLIMAMIKVESNFMPYAISSAGAVGLMQLLPSTARTMNIGNLYAPKENIEAGVRYFKYLYTLFNGNYIKAIAAYNAGEKAVLKYNGIPPYPETQWYVTKVLKAFWKMKGYTQR